MPASTTHAGSNGKGKSHESMRDAWGAVQEELEQLYQELATTTSDRMPELRGRLQQLLERARSSANDSITDARSFAQRAKAMASEKATAAVTTTEHYVGSHPWQSLALAGAVGLLIGFLASRR